MVMAENTAKRSTKKPVHQWVADIALGIGFVSLVLILFIIVDAEPLKIVPLWAGILPLVGLGMGVFGVIKHRSRTSVSAIVANSLAIVGEVVVLWHFFNTYSGILHVQY